MTILFPISSVSKINAFSQKHSPQYAVDLAERSSLKCGSLHSKDYLQWNAYNHSLVLTWFEFGKMRFTLFLITLNHYFLFSPRSLIFYWYLFYWYINGCSIVNVNIKEGNRIKKSTLKKENFDKRISFSKIFY